MSMHSFLTGVLNYLLITQMEQSTTRNTKFIGNNCKGFQCFFVYQIT